MSIVKQAFLLAPAFSTPERLHFPLFSIWGDPQFPQWFYGGLSSSSLLSVGMLMYFWKCRAQVDTETSRPELWHYIMSSVLLCIYFWFGWLFWAGFFDRQWQKRHLRCCPQDVFLCLFTALNTFLHVACRPGQSHLHIWRCSHTGSTK